MKKNAIGTSGGILENPKDRARRIASSVKREDPIVDTSRVPKNEKGGVAIDEEELATAFDFLDTQRRGNLHPRDLSTTLNYFYKNLTMREFKFLIQEPDFTVHTLRDLLEDNDVKNFDPVREAFKVYDPHETGYADLDAIKSTLLNLGFESLSEEDVDAIFKCCDVDGDGKISMEDFREMLEFNRKMETEQEELGQRYLDATGRAVTLDRVDEAPK
eukprot:GFYU01005520.1.p1 GENE.GFYU01005520.1~~GFYU01005520.1.p1  ORF type:complete len:216 (-),score=61.66 GFYU01005520.1:154-801(-)